MSRIILASALIASLLAAGCSSSQQGSEADSTRSGKIVFRGDTAARRNHVRPEIGARSCRVIGTIVEIDPAPHSNDPSHLAAKYPSVATIRVDSVLLTGNAFSESVAPGSTAKVTFAMTLLPTKDIEPRLPKDFPGLSVGARFKADLMDRRLPGEKAARDFATTPLVVFDYQAL